MKIAIVDDIEGERSLLHNRLKNVLDCRGVHADIFEYESGEDYLAAARKQVFAVSFLDIYMGGMTGIETADQLRTFDKEGLLIFTTVSTDHALEGFRVHAMQYLVKPYDEKDIDALTETILSRISRPDKYMDIKVNGSDIRLHFQDIVHAEHFSHMIHICTINEKELVTRQSFREFTDPLKMDERFFLCTRGSIVNMEHAVDFNGSAFVMNNGEKIAVSRVLIKAARQAFMDFLFRRGNKL